MKKQNIGFVGPYCTANVGDWAMLINNIYDFGNNNYYIFTYSSKFPHDILKQYCSNKSYSTIEVKLTSEQILEKNVSPTDCLQVIDNYEEIVSVIKKLDIMVVSGGGFINDSWCSRYNKFYKIMAPLIISSNNGIPVRFMSQSIGPINKTKDIMISFFNCLNDVVLPVRDDYCSSTYLKMITNKSLEVFLPDDLCKINKTLLNIKKKQKSNYVVFVVNESTTFIKKDLKAFKLFCKEIKDKFGLETVFLSFDLWEYGEKQSILLNKIIKSSIIHVKLNNKYITIEEIGSIINNAELVITQRYHAVLFAIQLQTPFVIMLDRNNDLYAYNKAHGITSLFFKGLKYDERNLIFNDWNMLFFNTINNYAKISEEQNKMYKTKQFKNNLVKLTELRRKYIAKVLNSKKLN